MVNNLVHGTFFAFGYVMSHFIHGGRLRRPALFDSLRAILPLGILLPKMAGDAMSFSTYSARGHRFFLAAGPGCEKNNEVVGGGPQARRVNGL